MIARTWNDDLSSEDTRSLGQDEVHKLQPADAARF
jgi:hypothetical protein